MFNFNDRSMGIFSDGFKDRDGTVVGDTTGYRLRARLTGCAGANWDKERTAQLVAQFSSPQIDAILDFDGPHVRIEYDANYFGGPYGGQAAVVYVPEKLCRVEQSDLKAFAIMRQMDPVHVVRVLNGPFDCDGESMQEPVEACVPGM